MGQRILLVEGDAHTRETLVHLLRPHWTVDAVADGQAALAATQVQAPDLILADTTIGAMQGTALVRAVRLMPLTRFVPVILLATETAEADIVAGLDAGADDFLLKPVSARELVTRIGSRLKLARDRAGALRVSEMRFKRLAESNIVGIAVSNVEGRILEANDAFLGLLDYSRAELVAAQLKLETVVSTQGAGAVAWRKTPGAADRRPRELDFRRKDGSSVPVLVADAALEDGETLLLALDISERKRVEEELRRSNADLEQFAYVSAHDLKEPLRMVANYTELLGLQYKGRLDAEADKYIFYAVDGAKRMQQLIFDLLSYSRVGSQGKTLKPVNADDIVRSVLGELEESIRETGSKIECAALPVVLADELQLRQVFQNLIVNAMKFHGSQPPQIRITAHAQGERVMFSVSDNGIGFDMKYADRIFKMFQRLHERGKFAGSGIGLAVVKRIVERHGGRVWVESQEGKGTTFYFTLTPGSEGR